jgi:hypothetical protein
VKELKLFTLPDNNYSYEGPYVGLGEDRSVKDVERRETKSSGLQFVSASIYG